MQTCAVDPRECEICGGNPFKCQLSLEIIERNIPYRLVKFTLPAQAQVILQALDRIIAGYASIEIIDAQGEVIPAEAWHEAFAKFMANPKFRLVHVFHTDIPIGEVITEYKDSKDRIWRSHVDDRGLFVVVRLRKDLVAANRVWDAILKGQLRAFSISGLALERRVECAGGRCFRVIPRLELHSITVCEKGANPGALFAVVKSIPLVSLLRMQTKPARQKMSEEEILNTPEDLSMLENAGSEGKPSETPTTPQSSQQAPESKTSETQKQAQPSADAATPLLLEMKARLDQIAGQMEKLVSEMEKARKPQAYPYPGKRKAKEDEEEEEEEEKAGKKPEEYPYPEEKAPKGKDKEEPEEKAGKKPEEYPYPEEKAPKGKDKEEPEEKAGKKPKYPAPPTRKGEVLAIGEEDLAKMIEEKASEIAEKKVTEILQKSLGKTEKRGQVPDIGGPSPVSGPQALLKTPLAKLGTMPRQEFWSQLRGGQ